MQMVQSYKEFSCYVLNKSRTCIINFKWLKYLIKIIHNNPTLYSTMKHTSKILHKYTFINHQMYDMPLDTTLYACGTNHRHLIQPYHNRRHLNTKYFNRLRWIQSIIIIFIGYKYPTYECKNISLNNAYVHPTNRHH